MAERDEIPLHLCQVLEEEIENLPSPPPAGEMYDCIYVTGGGDEENAPGAAADPWRLMGDPLQQVGSPPYEVGSPPHEVGSPPYEVGSLHYDASSPPEGECGRVTVKEDWGFYEGHVRDGKRLASVLRHAAKEWQRTHAGSTAPEAGALKSECDLYVFLAFRYPKLCDDAAVAGRPTIAGHTILDRILRDEDEDGTPNPEGFTVFTPERFDRLTLEPETRALFERWEAGAGAAVFAAGEEAPAGGNGRAKGAPPAAGGRAPAADEARRREERDKRFARSDLARFRRLLLEDAFPGAVRRVYELRVSRAVNRLHAARCSALCLSGGGIRSGTFALGVIQSLARRGFLGKFDYLSTVSGGGYIGGWLTAWIHRHPNGLEGVVRELGGQVRGSKLEPEPEPLRHLRDYSNFITPRTGLLSADTWTFVVIYIRNLLLNWVVLVPLLASLLIIPRVSVAVVLAPMLWPTVFGLVPFSFVGAALLGAGVGRSLRGAARGLLRHVPLVAGLVALGAAAAAAYFVWPDSYRSAAVALDNPRAALLVAGALLNGYALAFMRLHRPSNSGIIRPGSFWDKRRDQNVFLWYCLLPLCIAASILTTFWAWHTRAWHTPTQRPGEGAEFGYFMLFGFGVGLAGLLCYWFFVRQTWESDPAELRLRELRRASSGGRTEADEMAALANQVNERKENVRRNLWGESWVMLVSNLVGAFLLWVAATRIDLFDRPVVPPVGWVDYHKWWGAEIYTVLAFPVYLLVIFLGITLFVGFTSRRAEKSPKEREADAGAGAGEGGAAGPEQPPTAFSLRRFIEDEDREWLARASAWLFIVGAGWLFFATLVIFGPSLYFAFEKWLVAAGGVSGLITILGGRSAATPGRSKKEGQPGWQGTLRSLGVNLVVVASFVFFVCLVLLVGLLTGTVIAWLGYYLQYLPDPLRGLLYGPDGAEFARMYPLTSAQNAFRVAHFPTWLYLASLAVALHGVGRLFSSYVLNLNKFSLHAGYRDRIIRAFLGASRPKDDRQENPFTGFDPRDNLYMDELRPWTLRESDFVEPDGLATFVRALARSGAEAGENAADGERGRAAAARVLRRLIEQSGGQSVGYFERDAPESIDISPSFRSALFGDLSRILQTNALDAEAEFAPYLAAARGKYAELAAPGPATSGVLLNRLLLLAAFPDCLKYPPRLYRLMHVVNMALNLVGGDRLAWQQRRAESFTATPLHSGSLFVGYRRTRDYGGQNGISLGTAVAISGAAASSNMGYFSPSPFVTLALTFFNARLGWWLGNPGVRGADTYFRSHPKSALSPILDEAFGLTDDQNPYVLLSDGGHFENLGLYEMVVRRCRNIFVVDGSADPEGALEGLGDAVRKIRIDLGIPIEFEPPFPILPRPHSEQRESGGYCAVGDIHYEAVDASPPAAGGAATDEGAQCAYGRHRLTGRLIYIKPTIYGTEPRDIFNYARSHLDFPHESTADQFFDEPQFESHRMLGYYILEELFAEALESPEGRQFCATRDLQKFVDWLDVRAGRERERDRERAAGSKKD